MAGELRTKAYSAIRRFLTQTLPEHPSTKLPEVKKPLVFKETLTLPLYVGVSPAICSFLALALLPAGVK